MFYCYSNRLKNFLYLFGEKYVSTGINSFTGKKYYVFVKNTKLKNLLEDWYILKNKYELFINK